LSKSKDPVTGQLHDVILVIIDRLMKWGYFVACTEEISAEDVAWIYVKEVFAQYGSPDKIISDKDLKFMAVFWKTFLAEQRIWAAILTVYYPQTDGQTERLNQILEQYLWHYVNYAQNNWLELLPIAQFAYNATPQKGIKMLLFKVNYGYALRTLLLLKQAKKSSKVGKERAEKLIILHKELCKSARMVQKRIKMYYNKKRSEGSDLKEGDKVWLLYKNFKSW